MRKAEIPKPKYALGEHVVFAVPSEGNMPPRREVGRVSEIQIRMKSDMKFVTYRFEGHAIETEVSEDLVVRRVRMN